MGECFCVVQQLIGKSCNHNHISDNLLVLPIVVGEMFRARGTSISLRDLRIAKLQKRFRFTPCGPELDTFLAAVAAHGGNEDDIPNFVKMALSQCMEASVSDGKLSTV